MSSVSVAMPASGTCAPFASTAMMRCGPGASVSTVNSDVPEPRWMMSPAFGITESAGVGATSKKR